MQNIFFNDTQFVAEAEGNSKSRKREKKTPICEDKNVLNPPQSS